MPIPCDKPDKTPTFNCQPSFVRLKTKLIAPSRNLGSALHGSREQRPFILRSAALVDCYNLHDQIIPYTEVRSSEARLPTEFSHVPHSSAIMSHLGKFVNGTSPKHIMTFIASTCNESHSSQYKA